MKFIKLKPRSNLPIYEEIFLSSSSILAVTPILEDSLLYSKVYLIFEHNRSYSSYYVYEYIEDICILLKESKNFITLHTTTDAIIVNADYIVSMESTHSLEADISFTNITLIAANSLPLKLSVTETAAEICNLVTNI